MLGGNDSHLRNPAFHLFSPVKTGLERLESLEKETEYSRRAASKRGFRGS